MKDQIAVSKTMEEELKNTEAQLDYLRNEKMNKMKMVQVEYEYGRLKLKGVIQ